MPSYSTDMSIEICPGDVYILDGVSYSEEDNYLIVYQSEMGCDSTINLQLDVLTMENGFSTEYICEGDVFLFNGISYSSEGVYPITLVSSAGCDSTLVLTINHYDTFVGSADVQICEGSNYTVAGQVFSQAGSHTLSLTSSQGCDSTAILNLSYYEIEPGNDTQYICENGSYTFEGVTYTEVGNYTVQLLSDMGCDSLLNLTIEYTDNFETQNPIVLCDGQSYTINDHTYTSSGAYIDTLVTASGCDSMVYTQLTIEPTYAISWIETLCQGDSYEIDGQVITTDGSLYTHTYTSMAGCDSSIAINFVFNENLQSSINYNLCLGDSLWVNDQYYYDDAVLINTYNSNNNCDSTVTTNILFTETLYEITDSICMGSAYDFQGQSLSLAGDYTADLITSMGCDSTILLHLVYKDCPLYFPTAFSPNNDGYNDIAQAIGSPMADFVLRLYNRWGRMVFESRDVELGWDGKFNGKEQEIGVYAFYIEGVQPSGKKLMLKGNLTLIR